MIPRAGQHGVLWSTAPRWHRSPSLPIKTWPPAVAAAQAFASAAEGTQRNFFGTASLAAEVAACEQSYARLVNPLRHYETRLYGSLNLKAQEFGYLFECDPYVADRQRADLSANLAVGGPITRMWPCCAFTDGPTWVFRAANVFPD